MLQKAIIEKKLDKYSMKVRIPVYNKVKSDPTATPTNELYTATIQTLPGCSPNYQEGDVVIVDFENDDLSFPIIIGLLYREGMPEGSTDITADSLVVNVNTNLSENTLIGEVTPDSLKKLNDKYSNNVKAISIEYSLSNYQDHYDSFSNWSEQAPQYWPGKFMWQRTTVTYEDGTIMRSMTCIQGAQGSAGSGATIEETYVKYAISSNGTTPPDITQSGIWFPNPPKTTDVNPYLWSWTYTRFSDGKTNSAFGVSRVSTNSAIVYLYKRSIDEITAIDWTENLTYDFDNKKLTAAPAGWSEEIPSGSEPLYVTAATASSITAQATILPAEWSIPTLFSTSGLNSKTVLLYKRYGSTPATPSTAVTYTFSTGAIQPASPDGWSLTIPNTDGNPCYVTQATAIGYGDNYTIQKNAWSTPTVLAKDGNSDYIDQPVVDWYIVTNNTNTPTSPTADIEVETEWTGLGWTQDMSSLELSASNKYLWNAEVTHYTISGYIKTSPHIITTFAETGKGIQDIEDKFALNNDPENPPAKGSAVWGDSPITPTPQNKYLWKYEIIHYTTGDSKETTPTVISMYSAPGEEGAPGLSAAAVFLYQRATSASSITKPTGTLTYTFATGTLSGQLGDWKQSIPASDGNPCFSIQATAVSSEATDTILPSEWSSIVKLVEDGAPGKDGTDGTDGTNGLNTAIVYLYKRSPSAATINWTQTLTYSFTTNKLQSVPTGWHESIPDGTDPIYMTAATASSITLTDTITKDEWAAPILLAKNGTDGQDGKPGDPGTSGSSAATVFLYKRGADSSSVTKPTTNLTYTFETGVLSGTLAGWSQTIPGSDGNPCFMIQATAIGTGSTDIIEPSEWSEIIKLVEDGAPGQNGTDGKDGTDGTNGVNTAIVYLYKRDAAAATIDWTTTLTYNFTTKKLVTVPSGWSSTIPSGTYPLYVTAATAASAENTDTITPDEWATPVILAQNGQDGSDGTDGVSITAVVNYYLATNLSADVTRQTEGWTTDIQTISSEKPYLWNYEEVKYSNTLSTYTDPCIIGTYGTQGEQGSAGVGITSIVEYYALSTTTTRPTTGWSTNLPSMDATNRYLWNYSVITYTNGDTSGSVTDALIIGVYGDSVLSVEIQADNGTLFNAKATSTTLSADVYLGVKQLTVSATGVVKDGATTMGQLNWFAKERFTGNGTSTTFDLGLDILNATTSPKVEITINGITTTEFTVVDKDTIKFNTAPADESIILIQYLTSTSDKVTVTRTDVRGQVVIICKVVSSSKTLALSEVTIKDLNDASSLKSWYMLTVDNITFVSAPTVIYDENDSSVVPTGEYKHKVGDTEEVTVSFTWQDSAPIVNSGTVSKLCYTFQMIIFSDNSCTAGTVERSAAFDAGVVSWLQAQEAKDAADNAQSSADNAQNTANDALDGTHQNAENIQHVQQTLTAIDGVLAAKLDTVTFTPYKDNIDAFMQFDVENGTMTLGKGNFKQQMSPTKNSFMEGSTEVAYISNQELYINNATVNNKLSLDEQWVITFDSSSGLIIKHL